MRPENIEFLERNRDCYNEILNAKTAKKAHAIWGSLLQILRDEFYPGYAYHNSCGNCLFNMVSLLYREFDKWKERQPKEYVKEPIKVKANFPKHKRRR